MVILSGFLHFALFFAAFFGETNVNTVVDVSATIDLYEAIQDKPLKGTITITHPETMKVDESSFLIDDKPLKVSKTQEVKMASGQSIYLSIYSFELSGKTAGLYVLPSVRVKVGNNVYASIPSSYEVSPQQTMPIPNPVPAAKPQQKATVPATLMLESFVEGPKVIYPGQRIQFVYKFYYTGDIELTKEELPLLDAKDFKVIGEKQIKESQEGNTSIREIRLQVEPESPGEYSFPKSVIEGFAYQENLLKKRTYFEPKLVAETAPITITVSEFPQNRPKDFHGAVGQFTLSTSINGPKEMNVGDQIDLLIDVQGKGEFSLVNLPDISELKTLFRIDDLPPEEKTTAQSKQFRLKIYPLSTNIRSIPPISFTFYNNITNQFQTVQSKPIAITVNKMSEKQQILPKKVEEVENKEPVLPSAIEIYSIEQLKKSDLRNLFFGSWNWIIILFPLFVLGLLLQSFLKKRYEEQKNLEPRFSSEEIFANALKEHDNGKFYHSISHALIERLYEIGQIKKKDFTVDQLPEGDISGEVKAFLNDLQEKRYAENKTIATDETRQQASNLMKRMQR